MGLFSRGTDDGLRLDPHLADDVALVAAARGGETGPLAERLAGLREAGRTNHRDQVLALAVPERGGDNLWVHTWQRTQPGDQDAAVLRSRALVADAWATRAHGPGARVSQQQVTAFFHLMTSAEPLLEETARAWPHDSAVWAPLVDQCRGAEQGDARLHGLVIDATESASEGFGWRHSVVESLSAFWSGSLDDSWDFAVTSALAHPDSRLVLLPLYAAARGRQHHPTPTGDEMLAEALPEAARYVAAVADDEVELVHCANLVVSWLVQAGVTAEAGPFTAVLDGRVDSTVWSGFPMPPLAMYARALRA